jgi:hypothetical protein
MSLTHFSRPDGSLTPAYEAPANGPGLVLIQEWWGLNEQICGIADRFAADGGEIDVKLFGVQNRQQVKFCQRCLGH